MGKQEKRTNHGKNGQAGSVRIADQAEPLHQLIENRVLVTVRILGSEGLAAAEVGSGDDDGTTGIVDCVVVAANAVAGGLDPSEECFGFGKVGGVVHRSRLWKRVPGRL